MGLFMENENVLKDFLREAQELCPVRVLDYNHSERVFDNTIFYQSFVSGLMRLYERCRGRKADEQGRGRC